MSEETKKTKGFTADQMEIIQKMLQEVKESSSNRRPDAISMYNLRDPKSIETVNVKTIEVDGKTMYVLGFKNHRANDGMSTKAPRYCVYKADPTRGLHKEPYITLILSSNGEDTIEKEMMLVDYMNEREKYQAKCIEVKVKKVLDDYGYLGSSGEYAVAVDEKGNNLPRQTILAQVEREERTFVVELPGFKEPVEFIADFLS